MHVPCMYHAHAMHMPCTRHIPRTCYAHATRMLCPYPCACLPSARVERHVQREAGDQQLCLACRLRLLVDEYLVHEQHTCTHHAHTCTHHACTMHVPCTHHARTMHAPYMYAMDRSYRDHTTPPPPHRPPHRPRDDGAAAHRPAAARRSFLAAAVRTARRPSRAVRKRAGARRAPRNTPLDPRATRRRGRAPC